MKRIAFVLALFLSTTSLLSAQVIRVEPSQISLGGGGMIGAGGMISSWDAVFAAVQWHGVQLFADNMTTGVGIEIHPAAVFSYKEGQTLTQFVDVVDWRLWSLNRMKMSALQLPGEVWESIYIGSDLLIEEGGSTDFTGGFTARMVFGVQEEAGPGWIDLEIYMFEKYRPVSFSVFYRYNF